MSHELLQKIKDASTVEEMDELRGVVVADATKESLVAWLKKMRSVKRGGGMEELVDRLAELQEDRKAAETRADIDTRQIDDELEVLRVRSAGLAAERRTLRLPHEKKMAYIDDDIEETASQILEEWNGEKKTLQCNAWTLKFRTTRRLEIHDGAALLASLIDHFTTNTIAETYLSGFNRTAVKKFIDLHPQPPDVTELIEKTTVKLGTR